MHQQFLQPMMQTRLVDAKYLEGIVFEAPAKTYVKHACAATWIISIKTALSLSRRSTTGRQRLVLQSTALRQHTSKSRGKACQVF